jgi:hypothetical protein
MNFGALDLFVALGKDMSKWGFLRTVGWLVECGCFDSFWELG